MGNHDIWDDLERAGTGEHLSEEMFEFISAYADGECSAKERRLVEAYVTENAEARELLADLRSQAAMVGEATVDSPEWLRSAVISRTVEKRVAKWPFAAGLAAASAAAALVAATYLPSDSPVLAPKDALARNEPQPPRVTEMPPVVVKPSLPKNESAVEPIRQDTTVDEPTRLRATPRSDTTFRTVSAPVKEVEVSKPDPPVATPEETTDAESTTYAVAEYGSGRFQPKQPDPVDASATQSPETAKPAARPEVLPDAREKLRDKVRKLNEEKIEVGEKENSGS